MNKASEVVEVSVKIMQPVSTKEDLIVVCTCTVCGEDVSYPYEGDKITLCDLHKEPPPLSQDIIDRVHAIPVLRLKEIG